MMVDCCHFVIIVIERWVGSGMAPLDGAWRWNVVNVGEKDEAAHPMHEE